MKTHAPIRHCLRLLIATAGLVTAASMVAQPAAVAAVVVGAAISIPALCSPAPTNSPGLGQPMELPRPDAEGFSAMFNGKDLTGWDALPNFWSVKDGVIDCVETSEPGGNIQSDLIWMDSQQHPEKVRQL
jgi:hypothetical protein